ncbi:type III-B CRISPR module-associated protein Cmr3 [Pyrinomonas methylaliphatogenes]|uniref:CRISPR type III-B/RAMP module-associated protein Cmr3 n=1 Tax=Pyrinomonas methylaliphatogenes TaxID=454194 RepID=A0A0B6X1I3_9BACT|nr:type III-B CRISPR module-associated protein Cmr3 [Pyrinomonas methylaliphatogenes]CDM67156.1 CRISPR type III-B/RAMP module-associated protein Cmr3 [Pyrinomonas methylaliphatogenes]
MSFALVIQPHDVLLFRDGKPFSAGTDIRARSLFPPTPFTIQGAIRARVLFSSGVSPADYAQGTIPAAQQLHNLIGTPQGGYGQLRLRGLFLARRKNDQWVRYFPVPADVKRLKGSYILLKPLQQPQHSFWQSNLPDNLFTPWLRTTEHIEDAQGWISEEDLRRYLAGNAPQEVLEESCFVEREHRFGIALERAQRTVRESFLYLAEFLRLKEGVAFWVEVEGISPSHLGGDTGFLQLGGEARAAYYTIQPSAVSSLPSPPNPLPERFKVVLLTPAWFSDGWQPQGGNWGQFFNGSVRLVSAIIPRYQPIGGAYVDDQRRKGAFQKPMRRFVPAGSVYFFEHDGTASWAGQPFTETPSGEGDYGQIGFGTCVIGEWNYA